MSVSFAMLKKWGGGGGSAEVAYFNALELWLWLARAKGTLFLGQNSKTFT